MKKNFLFVVMIFLSVYSLQADYSFYSQNGQDRYIFEKFFKNYLNGTFIEIGAYDGVTYSNTYFFEKFFGWNGVCVEPNRQVFDKLKKNRNCACENCCITNFTGTSKFLEVNGAPEMLSGLVDKFDPRHRNRIKKEIKNDGGSESIVDVQCLAFNDLIDKHSLYHINLLSVDTEGGEIDILRSIDYKKVIIDIVLVEVNFNDNDIKDFMTQNGFVFDAKVGADEIYVNVGYKYNTEYNIIGRPI